MNFHERSPRFIQYKVNNNPFIILLPKNEKPLLDVQKLSQRSNPASDIPRSPKEMLRKENAS